MKHTEKYQLTQWESQDRIQMEAFNSDNAKIEAALAAETAARNAAVSAEAAARTAALALKGNCQIFSTSYTGTGGFGANTPNSLTFPAPPELVVVYNTITYAVMFFQKNQDNATAQVGSQYHSSIMTWTGNTVKWYCTFNADAQMNASKRKYAVVAFYAADN